MVVVGLLTIGLAAVFSSPDDPLLTFKGWATSAPDNFYATTVSELAGTSESAGYGPPYNEGGDGVAVGPINMQKCHGRSHPRRPGQRLRHHPAVDLPAAGRSSRPRSRCGKRPTPTSRRRGPPRTTTPIQATADDAGELDLDKVRDRRLRPGARPGPGADRHGGLGRLRRRAHGAEPERRPRLLPTDYTKQILFLGDGAYLDDAATAANLQGNTWGMMNETGSWPGQAWLWLYSFWYQIPVFNAPDDQVDGISRTLTDGADAIIFYIMACLTLLLLLLPFIPGLRSIPRWIPIHRLVWRDYYRRQKKVVA